MNSAAKLAEMRDFIARLDGQMDVHKKQIKRTLKSLKRHYLIDSTKGARARQKEIEEEIDEMNEKREQLEAEVQELIDDFD